MIKEHQYLSESSFIKILNKLYDNRNGYLSFSQQEQEQLAQENIFPTYGEILPSGVTKILSEIKPTEKDSFVDFGSGTGKIPLQFFLCSNIGTSYGIEANVERWMHSAEVRNEVSKLMQQSFNNRELIYIRDNILNFDLRSCNIVLMNSIAFNQTLMNKIKEKINEHAHINFVITSKELGKLSFLPKRKTILLETSWNEPPNKSIFYIYSK